MIKRKNLLQNFTKHVKDKKEFSGLEDEYVIRITKKTINEKILEKLEEHPKQEKAKEFKQAIKDVRKILHETHGVFETDIKKRKGLLEQLKKETKTKEITRDIIIIHKELLKTHQSTKERLNDYEIIYKKIKEITGKIDDVLDLSSGMNPMSWIFMEESKVNYTATELTKNDVSTLNEYFKIMSKYGIKGKAEQINLLSFESLPKARITFMFKILDNLESLERNITKKILEKIKSEYIIASFPKVSISGKRVSTKRLSWFNKIVKDYKTFETENEIFYVLTNLC